MTEIIECEHANCRDESDNASRWRRCLICNMVFVYCDPCSWDGGGPVYHTPPECSATPEEMVRKRAAYE
jgi:hypothetical protein